MSYSLSKQHLHEQGFNDSAYCLHFSVASLLALQVNKIRECPQHPSVVVTHTDAPQLFVWSTERQPNRQGDKVQKLMLTA